MKNVMKLQTQGDQEIVITRTFDAPRRLVWDANTKPELLKRWLFGPDGWALTVCDMDLRVGGKYRWVWTHEDGRSMGMGGVYREIVPPEKLVHTELFDEDWTGGEALSSMVLTEQGGKTLMTQTIRYASKAARAAVLQTPMEQGMAMGYDRLDGVLADLAAK